jgi:hypothetical protein
MAVYYGETQRMPNKAIAYNSTIPSSFVPSAQANCRECDRAYLLKGYAQHNSERLGSYWVIWFILDFWLYFLLKGLW